MDACRRCMDIISSITSSKFSGGRWCEGPYPDETLGSCCQSDLIGPRVSFSMRKLLPDPLRRWSQGWRKEPWRWGAWQGFQLDPRGTGPPYWKLSSSAILSGANDFRSSGDGSTVEDSSPFHLSTIHPFEPQAASCTAVAFFPTPFSVYVSQHAMGIPQRLQRQQPKRFGLTFQKQNN